ncbi:hypothetical protein QLX08_007865 [Tetragonisca angustula]|uniref:Uncharacterized protein n=1 Tax=Tetragonisca angustula TaxID=166442 RepID=A0AAW0ZNE8_9HYME
MSAVCVPAGWWGKRTRTGWRRCRVAGWLEYRRHKEETAETQCRYTHMSARSPNIRKDRIESGRTNVRRMKIRFSHEQGSDRVKADQLMTRARLIQPFGSRNDFSSYPSGIIRSTPPHTPHLPAGSLGSGSVGTEGVTTTPRDRFNP